MTSTELGYLSGVTSNIQTQLDGKALSIHNHPYTSSHYSNGSNTSFVKFMTITFKSTSTYFDGIMSFKMFERSNGCTEYILQFSGSTEPSCVWSFGRNITYDYCKSIFVHKASSYVFDIYTSGHWYGNMDIFDVRVHSYLDARISSITYPNEVASKPSDAVGCKFQNQYGDSLPAGIITGELFFLKSS